RAEATGSVWSAACRDLVEFAQTRATCCRGLGRPNRGSRLPAMYRKAHTAAHTAATINAAQPWSTTLERPHHTAIDANSSVRSAATPEPANMRGLLRGFRTSSLSSAAARSNSGRINCASFSAIASSVAPERSDALPVDRDAVARLPDDVSVLRAVIDPTPAFPHGSPPMQVPALNSIL